MKIHDNIHTDPLSPWKGNKINGVTPPSPEPEIIEGDKVLDSQVSGHWKKLQLLVQWKGYGEGHNSWQPAEDLTGSSDKAIADFYRTHPQAPCKITAAIFHSLPWQPYENLTELVAGTLTVEGG